MNRLWVLSILCLLVPSLSSASPYPIGFYETFDDGVLDEAIDCDVLVDTPPTDPAQSYVIIEEITTDGNSGLRMVRGEDALDPVLSFPIQCVSCGSGAFSVVLASPPQDEFGVFRMVLHLDGQDDMEVLFDEVGSYQVFIPMYDWLTSIDWSGHDVIVDDLSVEVHCGCVPNEARSWGTMKAAYR